MEEVNYAPAVLGAVFLIVCLYPLFEVMMKAFHARHMISQGYEYRFVITCSADPGHWQWVKKDRPRGCPCSMQQ